MVMTFDGVTLRGNPSPRKSRGVVDRMVHRSDFVGGGRGGGSSFSGGYDSGKYSRLTDDWNPMRGGTADEAIFGDLDTLRDRSRDLERNNPIAESIFAADERNVVGCGMRPRSAIDHRLAGVSPERAQELREQAESIFKRWAPHASADERTDFYEMQKTVQRLQDVDGEYFARPVSIRRPGRPYPIAIELVQADRVSNPTDANTARVRQGVELGRSNQPVAYYIEIPDERGHYTGTEHKRLPAWDGKGGRLMFHGFRVQRPQQTRGVPRLAAVMGAVRDLGQVLEAERVAARIAACLTGAITKDGDQWGLEEVHNDDIQDALGGGTAYFPVEPGAFEQLLPGENVTVFKNERTGAAFIDYLIGMVRFIGAGVQLPGLEALMLDFSKTSYSSGRMARLEAQRHWKCQQTLLQRQFCSHVYAAVLESAWLQGDFEVEDFYGLRDVWTASTWVTQGWDWVDPLKDVNAAEKAINLRLSSPQREAAARGLNHEDLIRENLEAEQREKDLREEMGLSAPTTPGTDTTPAEPEESEEDEEEQESGDDEEDATTARAALGNRDRVGAGMRRIAPLRA